MSQAKVDKYKEQKRNRAKIMKREKRERLFAEIMVAAVVIAIIVWAGFSVYQKYKPVLTNTYAVDTTALDEYMSDMNASDETEAETEASTEDSTEAASETEEVSETEAASETVEETAAETTAE